MPHISLVFREMWDTTALRSHFLNGCKKHQRLRVVDIPHLAKNERDVGHPGFVAGKQPMEKQPDPLAVVCSLPEGSLSQRRAEIHALLESRTALTHHPDGVEMEWTFSEETARSLLDFILFERTCCRSFTYELRFPPPHTSVTLRLRASSEQVKALQALYC